MSACSALRERGRRDSTSRPAQFQRPKAEDFRNENAAWSCSTGLPISRGEVAEQQCASTNLTVLPVSTARFSRCRSAVESLAQAAFTLDTIEEQLAALVDTLDIVPADQEDELLALIGEALIHAVDKRDSMGRFLAHVDAQIDFADAEIKRLQERKGTFSRILDRTESYIVRILQALGQDAKGKWQKLEGRTVTFSLRRQPPSVAIDNESDVPSAYRKATIRIGPLWEELLDSVDVEPAACRRAGQALGRYQSPLVEAIAAGAEVPGAH